MKRAAIIAWAVAGLAAAGFAALAVSEAGSAPSAATTVRHPQLTATSAREATPNPTPTPTPDPDRVIWLGDGISVKAGELPNGCTTYSKIEIFDVNSHSYGRLIGDPEDRGPSAGATGTVNRDAAGSIVSYTAAPGDNTWTVGDRFCTNPLMIERYNHIGSDPGDHTLQPGETVVIRPDMSLEWRPAG